MNKKVSDGNVEKNDLIKEKWETERIRSWTRMNKNARGRDLANSLVFETKNELTSKETKNVSLNDMETTIHLEQLVVDPTWFELWENRNSEFAKFGSRLGGILFRMIE